VKSLATALFLVFVSAMSFAVTFKAGVFSPAAGVICDKQAGFCADSMGISMELTKEYLGEAAQQKMLARGADADMTTFTLMDGVKCDAKAQKCTVSKYSDKVDVAHTQAMFGTPTPKKGPVEFRAGVYSPMAGVLCDRKSGFCADSSGISMELTKEYLGEAAQKKMLARGADADVTTFTLMDGVHCEVKTQKCMVSKYSDKVDVAHTKAMFSN